MTKIVLSCKKLVPLLEWMHIWLDISHCKEMYVDNQCILLEIKQLQIWNLECVLRCETIIVIGLILVEA